MISHTHLHLDEDTNIDIYKTIGFEDSGSLTISFGMSSVFLSEDQALLIAKKINELTKED